MDKKKDNKYKFERVTKLGIDEFSLKKGHKNFLCVLVDLEDNSVIDVLKQRTKEYLITYFKELGDNFCKRIKVLSSDMWDGFAGLVGSVFPNAQLVIDRFHFFKNLNKSLDNFRKQLKRTLFKETNLEQGKLRFALLKPSEKLTIEEREILKASFEISMDLKIFYTLKEDLRNIFEQKISKADAVQKITKWKEQAQIFNNKHLNVFVNTFTNWWDGVLNFFIERITNGVVEGKNNKIKMLKRRGFGFINFFNFRARILNEC
jgi:transposase